MRNLGIDLGTTNSVAAIDGNVVGPVGPGSEEASRVLPSVVAFPPAGSVLVGAEARARRAIDPLNTIFSSKRLMGSTWHSYAATRFRAQYPFELVECEGGTPVFRTRAGDVSPVEIGEKIVRALLQRSALDPQRLSATLCVPAAFDQAARNATLEAARRAGIGEVSLVDEPVATATAYLTTGAEKRGRFVVYDLGGGTFDVAVLDGSGEEARLLAHGGDSYLGGDDVDHALATWIADEVVRAHGWDLRADALVFDRLLSRAEQAKIELCFATQTRVDLTEIDPAAPLTSASLVVDRAQLEQVGRTLVTRTFAVCDEALRAAGLKTRDVTAVFLAGGATLLPSVRKGVADYFAQLPRCDIDPLEVVAIGASLT